MTRSLSVTSARRTLLGLGASLLLAVGCGSATPDDGAAEESGASVTASGSGSVRLGIWGGATPNHPGESTVQNFERWQTDIGHFVTIFRSRGGEGQLDDDFLAPESKLKVQQGHRVSLQLQPKVGTGANRHGICYENTYACIASGQYDTLIRGKLAELKALPPGTKHLFEVHSECNIQHGRVDAQPTVGTASQYPAFFRKIHDLAVAEGVRDRLLFTVSMTRAPWSSTEWRTWLQGIENLVDVVAVDGYSTPQDGQAKSLQDVVTPMFAVSTALGGKPIAVTETGCQEDPQNPAYKATWDGASLAFIKAHRASLYAVFFNTSDDGPGGYYPDTTTRSKNAFLTLARDSVWGY